MFQHNLRDNDVIKQARITPASKIIFHPLKRGTVPHIVQSLTKYPDCVSDQRGLQRLPISEHGSVGGQHMFMKRYGKRQQQENNEPPKPKRLSFVNPNDSGSNSKEKAHLKPTFISHYRIVWISSTKRITGITLCWSPYTSCLSIKMQQEKAPTLYTTEGVMCPTGSGL